MPTRTLVTTGFIRVRRRKLKGKLRPWRRGEKERALTYCRNIYEFNRLRRIEPPSESASYDLVRAVRVGGKPRHKFVLGFGSITNRDRKFALFWIRSFYRMAEHGFTKEQCFQIAEKLKHKGVPLPTVAECENHQASWRTQPGSWLAPYFDELIAFIRHSNRPRARKGGEK
jgi:hypothetical protein